MGKWVTWMMLGAFLVSAPILGLAQTTQGQDNQTMTADQQPSAAAVESQQTPPATEEQPPTMVTPSQPEMQPAKPLPPLALERRMLEARRPRVAKATSACPVRPACDRGTTSRKMARHRPASQVCLTRAKYHRLLAASRGPRKMVTHRMAPRKMVKHRAASHVCITRAKYHRLMAMARSHRRVAMHQTHRRIAMAGPTRR